MVNRAFCSNALVRACMSAYICVGGGGGPQRNTTYTAFGQASGGRLTGWPSQHFSISGCTPIAHLCVSMAACVVQGRIPRAVQAVDVKVAASQDGLQGVHIAAARCRQEIVHGAGLPGRGRSWIDAVCALPGDRSRRGGNS